MSDIADIISDQHSAADAGSVEETVEDPEAEGEDTSKDEDPPKDEDLAKEDTSSNGNC